MMSAAINDFRIESESMTIRIGAVSYLNTKPLIYGLSRRLPDANISLDLPSRLAKRLASGDLDVGLIPSIEA
ncbi:MAG: MqnA/MqnD/SBP family protein, partial [Planctomycetota bacterium]|nr:MqnA/MqnD/SBP family protein [Planctomycetota bacterium]